MSYEICKSFSVKNGIIHASIAANNVRPLVFYNGEWEATDSAIEAIARDIIWGCFQPRNSAGKIAEYARAINEAYTAHKTVSSWEKDRQYRLNRNNDYLLAFTRHVALPLFRKTWGIPGDTTIDIKPLQAVEEETAKIYEEARKAMQETNQISIRTAIASDVVSGYVALLGHDGQLYLAKRENYNNPILDDSDGSAVSMENATIGRYDLFDFFESGYGAGDISDDLSAALQNALFDKIPAEKLAAFIFIMEHRNLFKGGRENG